MTQKDIARHLKVSYITVQRALNNSGYVSKKLKNRIVNYADKKGYTPHKAAQVLVRNRIRNITIFSSKSPHYFWSEVLKGVNLAKEQIKHFNFRVQYDLIPDGNTSAYISALEKELKSGLDAIGIVYQAKYHMKTVISWIEDHEIPYLTLNVDAPDSKRICYIGPAHSEGGGLAAEFLGKAVGQRGCVGIVSFGKNKKGRRHSHWVYSEREEGFLSRWGEKFGKNRLRILHISDTLDKQGTEKEIQTFLTSKPCIKGLYFVPTIHEILIRIIRRVKLKGNMIIVTHDLYPQMERYLEEDLVSATIYQNPILQGYYAVKILENVLETGNNPKKDHFYLAHNLVLNANKQIYRNDLLFGQESWM
jgi:LacI family transcriptional regulator